MRKGIGRRVFCLKGGFFSVENDADGFDGLSAEGYACISPFNASDRVSYASFLVRNRIEMKTQTKEKFSEQIFPSSRSGS